MNPKARLVRLERSIKGRLGGADPDRLAGVLGYLRTGEAERIPAGVTFEDLQAAARQIDLANADRCPGLAELRDVMAEALQGRDILEFLAVGRPLVVRSVPVAGNAPDVPDLGGLLLRRLGLDVLTITVVDTRAGVGA